MNLFEIVAFFVLDFGRFHLPFLYSCISFLGVLLLIGEYINQFTSIMSATAVAAGPAESQAAADSMTPTTCSM